MKEYRQRPEIRERMNINNREYYQKNKEKILKQRKNITKTREVKMAKTGIKKYDELPSVRGLTDIDAIRAGFYYAKKKYEKLKALLDEEVKIQKGGKNGNTLRNR